MAARKDFAKPKRSGSSASRKRPAAPKKPAKKPFPVGLMLASLLLVAGLAGGLYYLTGVKPDATPAVTKPAATPKSKPVEKSVTPPEQNTAENKNRFEFYDMLRDSEVKPPADAYTSTPKDAKSEVTYLLQAGSFRVKEDAERMRAQLILMGLPNVHTDASTSRDGNIWYRVRTGPFDNRSQLAKAYDKLVRQNIQPLQIRQ